MKAMVLAAGLGTRLKEETTGKPKALVQIGGKTLLQHILEKLKKEGFSEVVVNVHHFSGLIKDFITSHDFGIPVSISDETDKLLDTGGGLKKAAPFFSGNDPVLIYNVDVLSSLNLSKLVEEHLRSGALATLVVRKRKTSRYFLFNGEKRLIGWMNKKTGETKIAVHGNFQGASEMAFSGVHIVSSRIFQLMPGHDRFSITDLYLQLAEKHFIKGYFDASEFWLDVGKRDELALARRLLGP
jgi:NDP-sugar pyrophosphorylase family protein